MKRVDDVCVAQIRHHCRIGRYDLEIKEHAVYKIEGAVNQAVVPDLGKTHLHGYGRDLGSYEGRLNTAGLTRINFERIRLEKLGETLNIREAEISIAPK